MPVGGGSARSPPRCRRCSSGSSNTSSWNSNLTSRPTNCPAPAPSATPTPRQSTTTCIAPSRPSVPASSRRGSRGETCDPCASSPGPTVRITRPMRRAMLRSGRVTHPAPESLIPYALGAADPATGRHVEDCPTCRAEIGRLREAAGAVRASGSLERLAETADCLDELTVADFVMGRLGPEARGPIVSHLLSCARCRSVVQAGGRLLADAALAPELSGAARPSAGIRWRGWSLPLGLAAAAALLLLLLVPRRSDDGSTLGLRDTTLTSADAPVPIAPRASAPRVDRLVWSNAPRRVRQRNDAARKALSQLRTAAGGGDSADVALIAAERLAGAYAVAWQDSFFVRQITRFRSLSPAARQATLAADSIRLAGNAALRTGAAAALQAWRESLRRYEALSDTADR